jgi:hypothetical protein
MKKKCKTVHLGRMMLLAAMPVMSAGLLAMLTGCEKPILPEGDDGNVHLTFVPTTHDMTTRGTVAVGDYFSRLAVQMFDADGNKVWDKVKTQTRDDDDFGTLNVGLLAGTYTVVAVGHSSPVTPTIKSTEMVQFTAKDGVKNSDTFSYCGSVTVAENGGSHELRMNRVTAMVTFEFTDETMPANYAGVRVDYTGGSANFNPTTGEGCTKSTQSELRGKDALYFFTFPYMSDEGTLKMTVTALDKDQNVLTTKVLTDVPVTRNRITRCQGPLFGDGDYTIYQTAFGITVNTDWAGEDFYTF